MFIVYWLTEISFLLVAKTFSRTEVYGYKFWICCLFTFIKRCYHKQSFH